ncbi:PAAR domain-containing protein [Burkholderia gladioli]|uniref:PAAR domain-containing protein n=1 Tax=Burkholderia gladioli TaxID=28095 RepID=UPI00163DEC9A|nr:PAAR domain-containing protein [Burkholderia gladioli]
MRRGFLLVGDKSAVGGVIVDGISGMTDNGREIARIGSTVMCPACQSPGKIVAAGSRLPGSMFGHQVALDGDVCACKCAPPPRMMWSDAIMFQDVDGGTESSSASSAGVATVAAAGSLAAALGANVGQAGPVAAASEDGASKLAGEPFSYAPLPAAGDATQEAARGVSESDEAECHEQYERDMEECRFYKGVMGGARFMDLCSQKAFQRYQQCRGY